MGCEEISRRHLLAALSLLPAVRTLSGQDRPSPTFSTDVKVVNLFATVRDRKGQIVRDLNKEDFLLEEDGRPQTIQYFARETNLPLTLGLLVDTSGSTRRVLPDERAASYRFLQQVLREDRDLAFLIHFDFEVELLQDLTGSRKALERALDLLETAQGPRRLANRGQSPGGPYPGRRGGRGPGGRGGFGGGTTMYDAVMLASDEIMKKQQGRKALILLTDGMDAGSRVTLSTAVEAAQRADTLAYAIHFEDPDGSFGLGGGIVLRGLDQPNGKKILGQIARETGGRFFEVSKKQPIDKVFAAIEEDLRNQYSLGYSTDSPAPAGGYRKIRLTTKQKGLIVQTREGYYPS